MKKLELQALVAAPVAVSVGYARLSSPASSLSPLPSYAGTDALIAADPRRKAHGSGVPALAGAEGALGLADTVEGLWRSDVMTAEPRRVERPVFTATCEQIQAQAEGMAMAAFGTNGYPSWRTRT